MAKLKITQIFRNTKDKQGNPFINKMGKPYERVAIKTEEYKNTYISGFGGEWNLNWKVGDVVNIRVEVVGEYLNFSRLAETDELREEIEKIKARVFELENMKTGGKYPDDFTGAEEEGIDAESLPF